MFCVFIQITGYKHKNYYVRLYIVIFILKGIYIYNDIKKTKVQTLFNINNRIVMNIFSLSTIIAKKLILHGRITPDYTTTLLYG